MERNRILEIFEEAEVIIKNTHAVYTSGLHGSVYIEKRNLSTRVDLITEIAWAIAQKFIYWQIDVVVSPAIGAIPLGLLIAYFLDTNIQDPRTDHVQYVTAEKKAEGEFTIKTQRCQKLLFGKRVLLIEDVVTTGKSLEKVRHLVRSLGGNIVAAAVLCNRGEVTEVDLDVPKLFSLINLPFEDWTKDRCPLCKANVPINTHIGKGI